MDQTNLKEETRILMRETLRSCWRNIAQYRSSLKTWKRRKGRQLAQVLSLQAPRSQRSRVSRMARRGRGQLRTLTRQGGSSLLTPRQKRLRRMVTALKIQGKKNRYLFVRFVMDVFSGFKISHFSACSDGRHLLNTCCYTVLTR